MSDTFTSSHSLGACGGNFTLDLRPQLIQRGERRSQEGEHLAQPRILGREKTYGVNFAAVFELLIGIPKSGLPLEPASGQLPIGA